MDQTKTMQVLISIIGFFGFCFAQVNSLSCVTCRDKFNCEGPPQECPSSDDVCMAVRMETKLQKIEGITAFVRQCGSLAHCDQFGRMSTASTIISFVTSCCSNDSCTPIGPFTPVEPFSYPANELFCPVCESTGGEDCIAQYAMACTGNQTQCVKLVETSPESSNTFKGCSTESFCENAKAIHRIQDSNMTTLCTKATENSSLQISHFRHCTHSKAIDTVSLPGTRNVPCLVDEDVCLCEMNKTVHGGIETIEHVLRCGKSTECNRAGTISHPDKRIYINTTCCDSDFCTAKPAQLMPISSVGNGLWCKSCLSLKSDQCSASNTMQCSGNETQCIQSVLQVTQGDHISYETMYGCTTDAICQAGNKTYHYDTKKIEMKITCLTSSTTIPNIQQLLALKLFLLSLLAAIVSSIY